jgi:hypothetical protein
MEVTGTFQRLPAMKDTPQHQLYLDIVGDSAHAARGLDLALGTGEVRW